MAITAWLERARSPYLTVCTSDLDTRISAKSHLSTQSSPRASARAPSHRPYDRPPWLQTSRAHFRLCSSLQLSRMRECSSTMWSVHRGRFRVDIWQAFQDSRLGAIRLFGSRVGLCFTPQHLSNAPKVQAARTRPRPWYSISSFKLAHPASRAIVTRFRPLKSTQVSTLNRATCTPFQSPRPSLASVLRAASLRAFCML